MPDSPPLNTCCGKYKYLYKSAKNLHALETRRVFLGLLQLVERVSQPRSAGLVSHISLILINVGFISVLQEHSVKACGDAFAHCNRQRLGCSIYLYPVTMSTTFTFFNILSAETAAGSQTQDLSLFREEEERDSDFINDF